MLSWTLIISRTFYKHASSAHIFTVINFSCVYVVFIQVPTIAYSISAVSAMSGLPCIIIFSGVSRCNCKGTLSTLLNIRALRAASTMKVTHTSCAIALLYTQHAIHCIGCTDSIQHFCSPASIKC